MPKSINFKNVSPAMFLNQLEWAQEDNETIRQATTPVDEITQNDGVSYFIGFAMNDQGYNYNNPVGFAISSTGELTSVFSTVKGMGDIILTEACKRGACHLDCFDGYLPKFYARHGFQEVRREANWTAGGPDVIFMERF